LINSEDRIEEEEEEEEEKKRIMTRESMEHQF
jgi:hypothetical protein